MNYDYVKAVLYAYPALDEIGEAVLCSAKNKAMLSYKSPQSTEKVAEEILRELRTGEALQELRAAIDSLLAGCSEEELYLFEYKYFRRKSVLQARFSRFCLPYSERSYFRSQERLLRKAGAHFLKQGWTEARFLRETGGLFKKVLRAISSGREGAVSRQRKRGRALCQGSS